MENVALNKTSAQNSTYSSYTADLGNDGSTSTFSQTTNATDRWWKVDLGAIYDIAEIQFVKYYYNRPKDYYVQTADDWDFTVNVQTIITETDETSSGTVTWDTDDFGSISTRYIRMLTHTSAQYLSIKEFRVFAEESQEEIEDASLDLSVYGQNFDDFQSFLRAHDGVELHNLKTALAAYNLGEEDFAGWLGAFFEDKEDFGVHLKTWATQYKNFAGDFDAKGQSIESLMSQLETAKAKYKNLAAFLLVTDGSVLKDLAAFLSVTDGSVLTNMGLHLKAIQSVPAFRSITAQRVSSVVHEVP